MARVRFVDAPARNDVYVGMLAVTSLAILVSIVALALELNEYGFSAEAKGPSISIPKDFSRPTPKSAGGATPAPMTRTEITPPAPEVKPAPAVVASEPAVPTPVVTPPVNIVVELPKTTEPKPAPEATPATTSAPAPVRPGFNPRFPGKQ
ncbi:MAG: hypothetical protein ACRC8S_20805 [Fimbriiglobus sp.]